MFTDLVHSFPFGKCVLQNAAAPVHWIPPSPNFQLGKVETPNSEGLSPKNCKVIQSRLSMFNYKQLQNHMANRRATSVLVILLPIEVIFLPKSRVPSLCRTEPPTLPIEVWIQAPQRQGNRIWVFMDTVVSISPWIGPCHGCNFFSFTENFVAQIWTVMEIAAHFYYSHHFTKMSS